MAKSKKRRKVKELTDEQYDKMIHDLDSFDNRFLTILAGTERYEIVPTVMDDGSLLTKEQYALIKTECSRLGLKVLYQISLGSGKTIFLNPETFKIGYTDEGMH